jgi:hypothetical protein
MNGMAAAPKDGKFIRALCGGKSKIICWAWGGDWAALFAGKILLSLNDTSQPTEWEPITEGQPCFAKGRDNLYPRP